MKHSDIIAIAQSRIKSAEAFFAKFAADLVQQPEHTVYWSMPLYSNAADLAVWKQVLNMAEGECGIEDIVETLEAHLVSGASKPASSSNFASNRLEQEKARAYAEAYSEFKRRLRLEAKVKEAASPTKTKPV